MVRERFTSHLKLEPSEFGLDFAFFSFFSLQGKFVMWCGCVFELISVNLRLSSMQSQQLPTRCGRSDILTQAKES
jgi:hypothetical protein